MYTITIDEKREEQIFEEEEAKIEKAKEEIKKDLVQQSLTL